MLAGDNKNKVVKSLQKEMTTAMLELVLHDRCETSANPTPYKAFAACHTTSEKATGPALSASEMAPLLSKRGALGRKNARAASIDALASVAAAHPRLAQSNPLVVLSSKYCLSREDLFFQLRYSTVVEERR